MSTIQQASKGVESKSQGQNEQHGAHIFKVLIDDIKNDPEVSAHVRPMILPGPWSGSESGTKEYLRKNEVITNTTFNIPSSTE